MHDITLIDGGMGQELLRRSLAEPTRLWSARIIIDQPSLVVEVHRDFIRSGARVITLSAYSATPERLHGAGIGEQFAAIQQAAVDAARQAVDTCEEPGVRIAGCLPPLVASYRPDLTPDFTAATDAYRRIVDAQAPHVDIMLCETMASIDEALAAATAAQESGLPVWVALTVQDDQSGTLRSGESLVNAVEALDELGVEGVLLNCSAPEAIGMALPELLNASRQTGAYANGFTSIAALEPGGTVASLRARDDLGPAAYAAHAMTWVDEGATLIGGCCEVGPDHIAAIHSALHGRYG